MGHGKGVMGTAETALEQGVGALYTDHHGWLQGWLRRRLENALTAMRESESETDSFRQADVMFHYAVMEISGNGLAENIAKHLYKRAVESSRYQGINPPDAVALTLDEHAAAVAAIARKDPDAAEKAMHDHIHVSWERRRLPDHAPRVGGVARTRAEPAKGHASE